MLHTLLKRRGLKLDNKANFFQNWNFSKRRRDNKPPLSGSGLNKVRILQEVKHPNSRIMLNHKKFMVLVKYLFGINSK